LFFFFFSSRRRHTRWPRDWSSDVCSSDLYLEFTMTDVTKIQARGEDFSDIGHGKFKISVTEDNLLLGNRSGIPAAVTGGGLLKEIGRASCRERVEMSECESVEKRDRRMMS